MTDKSGRDEPISPLREAAVQVHELYTELVAAGFKKSEALRLISNVLASGVVNGAGE